MAEKCTGLTSDCPEDVLEGFGVVCRISEGECDLEESCDGVDPACPVDELAVDGTPCTDGTCTDGVCVLDPDMGVPDGGVDMLAEAGADALTDAVDQDDSLPPGDGSSSDTDADAGPDAMAGMDALTGEGGPKSFCYGPTCEDTGSGCSCHISGGRTPTTDQPWFLALVLCGVALGRRVSRSTTASRRMSVPDVTMDNVRS